MLERLYVENYALIDKLEMELGPRLNIITGETGAGKSILLGALGLILGNRADTAVLKDQSRNCIVEGTFDVAAYGLSDTLEQFDLEDESRLVIRRIVSPAGKSRAYVNDCPVQLGALREIGARMIDIHSQHQSIKLSDEGFRTGILDALSADREVLETYRAAYLRMREAQREFKLLVEEAARNAREEEFIRYQYEELIGAGLKNGELAELESRQAELANAEEIQSVLSESISILDTDETGTLAGLKTIEQHLTRIAGVYPAAVSITERLRSASIEMRDIAGSLVADAERIEADPAALQAAEERIGLLLSLMRKHKAATEEELITLRDEYGARLASIEQSAEAISEAEKKVTQSARLTAELAERLSALRVKAGKELGSALTERLSALGMGSAAFSCAVSPASEAGPDGADKIAFLYAPDKRSAPQPVEKIASGGELSRIMLCLKTIVAGHTNLPAIVFDEIDQGVSGRIADTMGEMIFALAQTMQVVNITHLPQIAAKGDTHFVVYKCEEGDGIKTRIRKLSPQERVTEIAAMLSGSEITRAALEHARALLEE